MRIQNPERPDLTDLLRKNKTDVFNEINCVQIGQIESFDASTQTASISILIKRVEDVNADGSRIVRELPLLAECPVMVLTGGQSHLTMPIQAGDTCIVLFNDREFDNWFISGESRAPTTPRKHDLSDGIAIVGIRSLQNAIDDYLSDAVRLRYSSGSQIVLDGTGITAEGDTIINGNTTVNGETQFNGDSEVDGDLNITGLLTIGSGGGTITLDADLVQNPGFTITAGNGATGTFSNTITVAGGIVTGGT